MGHTADHQFMREARVLLMRLSRTNGFLRPEEILNKRKPYQIFSARNGYRKPVGRAPRGLVAQCLEAQWLADAGAGQMTLTGAGKRWLKSPDFTKDNSAGADNRRVLISDDPLAWLATRKTKTGKAFLDPVHLQAAEIFRRDFEIGQYMPSTTSSWSPVYANRKERRGNILKTGLPDAPRMLAAKQRFCKACEALGGELTSIVLEICCLMRGLEAAEARLEWPKRSAKIVLKIALGRLAEHYQLEQKNKEEQTARRIRSWGADGYRPEFLPPAEE